MRLVDYFRLGWANIVAHKKRAAIVVVIVGVMFGVLIAGSLLIQGVENTALDMMTRSTDGKVLVRSVAQQYSFCKDVACDLEADKAELRQRVTDYGGKVIEVKMLGQDYVLDADLVQGAIETELSKAPADATPVLAPLSTLSNWLQISMSERAAAEVKVRTAQQIREQAVGQVITVMGGKKYWVAGILPGSFGGTSTLALSSLGRKNPLDILLSNVELGGSAVLIIDDGDLRAETVITDEIWATFDTVKQAERYIAEIADDNCNVLDVQAKRCPRMKQYEAATVISSPVMTYRNFEGVWLVFKILAIALAVIGSIVSLSTYTRLVGKDKVIALYHAMGATKRQVVGVYVAYLLGLSLLASLFSLALGVGLVLIANLLSATGLMQVFTLGFGVAETRVWLFGWNNWIMVFVGLLLVVAPVCVVLNLYQFSSKKLAQKIK